MLLRISPIVKFILILAFSGLACNFSALGAEPTVNTVETEAAATVAAMLTEESKALPTATSLPTATETAVPTVAPSKTATIVPSSTATEVKPDTLAIVYIKDGNVVLWNADDGPRVLTSSADVQQATISEDGAVVAYTRGDVTKPERLEIWAVDTGAQANPRVLVSVADFKTLLAQSPFPTAMALQLDQLVFRPGTHEVAFGTAPVFDGPGYLPLHDLHLVNADTLVKQTPFGFKQGGRFTFSPDGKRVALVKPDLMSLANYDGTGLVSNVITFPQIITYSEYQLHPQPIWSADSTSLRVVIPPADPLAEPQQPTQLWSMTANGAEKILLATIFPAPFSWDPQAFAPDLSRVAYVQTAGENTDNIRALHLTKPDGSGDQVYDQGVSLVFLGWGLNSAHFAYMKFSETETGLYLGSITGEPVKVTSLPDLNWLGWVDANRYLYAIKESDNWQIMLGNQASGTSNIIETLAAPIYTFDAID
jgi:hypothetical protein